MSLSIQFAKLNTLPETLAGISFKSYKTSRGHDGATLAQFDLYIGKTKVGHVNEDDWSGSVLFTPVSAQKETLLLEFIKIPQVQEFVLAECGITSPEDGQSLEWAIIAIHSAVRKAADANKLKRKAESHLLFGEPNQYISLNWTKAKLKDIKPAALEKAIKDGLESAKRQKIPAQLINSPEQLKSLGVTFTQAA